MDSAIGKNRECVLETPHWEGAHMPTLGIMYSPWAVQHIKNKLIRFEILVLTLISHRTHIWLHLMQLSWSLLADFFA
jgi:hypothetical protein